MRKQISLEEIASKINQTRFDDEINIYDVIVGDYRISCLTGSHCESSDFGTVEVALMCETGFVKGIIHYMEYTDFARMIYEMLENESNIREIFLEYYEKDKSSEDQ